MVLAVGLWDQGLGLGLGFGIYRLRFDRKIWLLRFASGMRGSRNGSSDSSGYLARTSFATRV